MCNDVCLQDTTTGETLCVKDNPIILEKMDFPDPVIKVNGRLFAATCCRRRGDAMVESVPSFRAMYSQKPGKSHGNITFAYA